MDGWGVQNEPLGLTEQFCGRPAAVPPRSSAWAKEQEGSVSSLPSGLRWAWCRSHQANRLSLHAQAKHWASRLIILMKQGMKAADRPSCSHAHRHHFCARQPGGLTSLETYLTATCSLVFLFLISLNSPLRSEPSSPNCRGNEWHSWTWRHLPKDKAWDCHEARETHVHIKHATSKRAALVSTDVAEQLHALLTAGRRTRDDAYAHKLLKARLQEGSEDAGPPAHHQPPCLGLERQ